MTISATKILHSISHQGIELKSVLARYPRFIHAEELTHRILSTSPDEIIIQTIADGLMYDRNLSRNASSSRAIPVKRLIDDILRDTAMPIHWGKNQKGMQAAQEHDAYIKNPFHGHVVTRKGSMVSREQLWLLARDKAIAVAEAYDAAGYHKQIVNRLLEPFAHINVLITATDWDNFFELRDHKDAQPEIEALAKAIKAAFDGSEPQLLQPGEWHLPFITEDDRSTFAPSAAADGDPDYYWSNLIKLSVARCARTSYLTHDGMPPSIEEDLRLYDQLVGARPLHASPAEHQATPDRLEDLGYWPPSKEWLYPSRHGNLRGWIQNRKIIEQETFKEAA